MIIKAILRLFPGVSTLIQYSGPAGVGLMNSSRDMMSWILLYFYAAF